MQITPAQSFSEVQAEVKHQEARRQNVDWITIALALAIALWVGTTALLCAGGYIGLWAASLLNIVPLYSCQIVAHEASHGNIIRSGRHKRLLNNGFGYVFSALLFWDFKTFRHLHMIHHRETNRPHRDVDWLPAKTRPFTRLLRALFFFVHALAVAFKLVLLDEQAPRNRWSIAVSWVLFYAAAAIIFLAAPMQALAFWIGPAILATAALTLAHWSLHTEEMETNCPFSMTRVIKAEGIRGRLLAYAYLFQNHHLVHHLFPYVPFHRMALISNKLQDVYRRKNVEIVDLDRLTLSGATTVVAARKTSPSQISHVSTPAE
jgi:beta-carotene hydroxylase